MDFRSAIEVRAHQATEGLPEWVRAVRDAGWCRYAAAGLPTPRDEEWRYTNLRALAEADFVSAAAAPVGVLERIAPVSLPDAHRIVFVDGRYAPELSGGRVPPGCRITRLVDADATEQAAMRLALEAEAAGPFDGVAALSLAALDGDAVLVRVPDGVALGRVLQLVHVGSQAGAMAFPRVLLHVGAGCAVDVVETYVSAAGGATLVNGRTDMTVGQGSRVGYLAVQSHATDAFHLSRARFVLEADSRVDAFAFQAGGRLARHNLDFVLNGSGIDANLDGLYLLHGAGHLDNHTTVDHRQPSSTSNQLYKGILADAARAVFNGKIFVRSEAQQTNAYQLNRNLLLGERAKVDTKPQLEIFADDVRCTHGASVGQLDPDEVFYLQSRGVNRREAVAMLARGFAEDVLRRVRLASAADLLSGLVGAYFKATAA